MSSAIFFAAAVFFGNRLLLFRIARIDFFLHPLQDQLNCGCAMGEFVPP
jgi:hypothetical protein